ncbi:hypothetical protein [Embleya sp. NBC_00896]|uniref:hypothetical protein n=1 Tax=Embleya sp. NBC_00896 TaxID=2975961 RepID=UPI003865A806|nr:hypothetical protein OG928_03450 [Embleya sp. NBC_00896]
MDRPNVRIVIDDSPLRPHIDAAVLSVVDEATRAHYEHAVEDALERAAAAWQSRDFVTFRRQLAVLADAVTDIQRLPVRRHDH